MQSNFWYELVEPVNGFGPFEDFIRVPCNSALSNCPQELSSSVSKGVVQRLKLQGDSFMDCDGPGDNYVRRCRSDSTDSADASHVMLITSKDDCVGLVRSCTSIDRRQVSSRALHNFRVGLLTHQETIKSRRHLLPDYSSSSRPGGDAPMTFESSSGRPQDAMWDLLLQ
jgi:hypothetical protein